MKIVEKLETKRLNLRPIKDDDFQEFLSLMCKLDSENFLYFIPENKTYEKVELLIKSVISSFDTSTPIYFFLIIEKESDLLLGFCGLLPLKLTNQLKCIYGLQPQYLGNGYMIEALKKLFEYGFLVLNLTKIVAFIPPNNTKAWKVAERAGMKYMGHISYKEIQRAMFFIIDKIDFIKQTSY